MILKLFLLFLKIGTFSLGGGYPMMGFIYEEGQKLVGLTSLEFTNLLALELLASGPIAINAATYVGYIKGGVLGAMSATLGLVIPSVVISALVYKFLQKFDQNRYVQAFMRCIRFACAGVLFTTALNLFLDVFILEYSGSFSFANNIHWFGVGIFAVALFSLYKLKINPILVIVLAGAVGMFLL